ncbi:MAG: saccharopine dehydrogenase C-terminal domain-containing protein [Acidimicrobiia bacterium]|nr:saccharopine dehydrogenase C-terminal domain-containing protein [Acidimicrobiia bacterium]
MSLSTLVLGAGFVGRAAAWDLKRRGHEVVITDRDAALAARVGEELDVSWAQLDVGETAALERHLVDVGSVVSAVPYSFGVHVASAAVRNRCHYFDFGGNPTIVKQQLELDAAARSAGAAIVPDCGLAPGLANVMAAGLIEAGDDTMVDDVQIRVGVLPQHPEGTLQYQLVFYAGGLINEYAEPCEVIAEGAVATVAPLTRFEQLHWEGLGPLEAFSTAGGTSTMCQEYAGRVDRLEYKTIRYPGHGRIFAAMRELGLFATEEQSFGDVSIAPRRVLLDLLTEHLPQTGPDRTLVSVVVAVGETVVEQRIDDLADERFSSLSRTTAFPATALCDLIARSRVDFRGAAAMHAVAPADKLLPELETVGIHVDNR